MKVLYLIDPKQQMLEISEDLDSEVLKEPSIWEIEQDHSTLVKNYLPIFGTRVKILYLTKLSRVYKDPSPWRDSREIVHLLFGNPPSFNVDTFDKWWTLKHIPWSYSFEETFLQSTLKDFEAIRTTDDQSKTQLMILSKFMKMYEHGSEVERKGIEENIDILLQAWKRK